MASASETARSGTRRETEDRTRTRTRRIRIGLMLILPLIVLLAGAYWYLASERYVSTDDAYGEADIVRLSANVSGQVVAVFVHDNEEVKKGDPLLRLDDRPFRIAVQQAQAQLAAARLKVESLRDRYRQQQAVLGAAQATVAYQEHELSRQQRLFKAHVGSQQKVDAAEHALELARQQAANAAAQSESILASLGGNPDLPTEQHPLVEQAEAQLAKAKLDLGYTLVRAPDDGIVTNVSNMPAGSYLGAGTPAFALVETDDVWVRANFKETELLHMKPGERATVTVDAYPGIAFKGRVVSETPATGSQFSVLPPQNATGNWVKVVQRLPVRVAIENPDPRHPIRPGMSASVTVDTHYTNPIIAALDQVFG
ncbi:MAG: HlyD family secretion protein [Stellaceae bacterium]